ncbi:hypothetical protein F4559_006338 [Saccharothrix violaceirubra]|uniref:Uncharacterized protein n=1 Tax=Saccharothrix violaceirubra TaxID=413306 RepID=A0A7W7T9E6_9PSEU|nr:hypothetical protein [Saccharothrix violaceirubra]
MSGNAEWTADGWRELRSCLADLLDRCEEINGRLARVEDHLKVARTARTPPRRPVD